MLGKFYTFLFIFIVLFAFWYQRQYLLESSVQFNAQRMAESAVLPAARVQDFFISVYEGGFLKSTFSGKQMTYYTDASFKALQNIIYQEFNHQGRLILSLKTEEAHGQMLLPPTQANTPHPLFQSRQIKSFTLPGEVRFYYDGWSGSAHAVEMDGVTQMIHSKEAFWAEGPAGHLAGKGFLYDRTRDFFQIFEDVQGRWRMTPGGEKQ